MKYVNIENTISKKINNKKSNDMKMYFVHVCLLTVLPDSYKKALIE